MCDEAANCEPPARPAPLLEVQGLTVRFRSGRGTTDAVRGIDFSVGAGETVAIVGESGSGKSVTALSLTRLLEDERSVETAGAIRFGGEDVFALRARQLRALRGAGIAYIFQEPSASINPSIAIGAQIVEAIRVHDRNCSARTARERALELLDAVGIGDARRRFAAYPFEFSGGMLQRVMIAMALACKPRLLVADEPTTALDVTIERQIIDLLARLRRERAMAVLLITHNFGIVKGFADRVLVMRHGQIVESGPTDQILGAPQHPYTRTLIACIPRLGQRRERLATVPAQ